MANILFRALSSLWRVFPFKPALSTFLGYTGLSAIGKAFTESDESSEDSDKFAGYGLAVVIGMATMFFLISLIKKTIIPIFTK